MRLIYKIVMVVVIGFIGQSAIENRAVAQTNDGNLQRFFHYPYYYFPHNYWPSMGPKWPERPGQPYMPPPAYMANPPFREPHWRYESQKPQKYYSGFHFWLDQF
ncbi:MAG: hypothetical protein WCJ06_12240 [Planctomycetota bacterium]